MNVDHIELWEIQNDDHKLMKKFFFKMKNVNIIPMAGNGQRFIDAGYSTPKPLIKVKGQYMFKKAVDSLPTPDHWIFICQDKHIKESGIDIIIKNYFPNSDISYY